jgi:RNA polymerase sigma-70 factor, ECF subfamily
MTTVPPERQPAHADASEPSVTDWLRKWGAGDRSALDVLMPLVYDELRHVARRALRREAVDNTLQTTALINETYLRLAKRRRGDFPDRLAFYGVAAQLMRRILVDHARTRQSAKRGGVNALAISQHDAPADAEHPDPIDVLALHDALARLATLDPRQSRMIELRYFGGLTMEETAQVLGLSVASVKREWSVARAWLRRELSDR